MQKKSQLIKFYKYHGLGNDFIIIDLRNIKWKPEKTWLIKASNRNTGIGFDQALFISKDLTPTNSIQTFEYKIANADGTWANQCGNGARCVADWLMMNDKKTSSIYLKTTDRLMKVCKTNSLYAVDMSQAVSGIDHSNSQEALSSLKTPYGTFKCKCFYIGNPHIVLNLTSPLTFEKRAQIGEWCQNQTSLFPDGINVNFGTLCEQQKINLTTFERGAKETLSCASGACCTALAYQQWYNLNKKVTISMQLGELEIEINKNKITQTGNVDFVFCGFINKTL
jgi:diaminopimelate epimerase